VIGVRIPSTPKWAHDTVVNATVTWNEAQSWYQESEPTQGQVYSLEESPDGGAEISFTMPSAYSEIAVGWTTYELAPSSKTITATHTYLDSAIFSADQSNNLTARQYAFRLALHELGRVLGLGSLLDGRDIMDPRSNPSRVHETPVLSTLDLYALSVLASGYAPNFVTLLGNVSNEFVEATSFTSTSRTAIPAPEFNGDYSYVAIIMLAFSAIIIRRRIRG